MRVRASAIVLAIAALSVLGWPTTTPAAGDGTEPRSGFLLAVVRFDSVATPNRETNRIAGQLAGLATDLARSRFGELRRIRLVDQDHVDEAMRIIAASHRRDFDEAYRLDVGRQLKARYICYGRVSLETSACRDVEKHVVRVASVTVHLSVMDVPTSTVLTQEEVTIANHELERLIAKDRADGIYSLAKPALARAIGDAVRDVGNAFPVEARIVAVEKGRALIDLGTLAGIERSMKFTVMRSTGTVPGVDGGEPIPKPEERVGEVEVTQVGERSSWVRAGAKEAVIGDRVVMKPKRPSTLWTLNEWLKPAPCVQ